MTEDQIAEMRKDATNRGWWTSKEADLSCHVLACLDEIERLKAALKEIADGKHFNDDVQEFACRTIDYEPESREPK